ncbi:hypothetical protein RQP46_003077 [Phenoliferia psychrophenolica]
MASPPRPPPTVDDFLGSPASNRKVSAGETLRALAAADSPRGSPPAPSQSTPQPSRRRSMKDRTPRQVQAVLSARKSKTNASAKKLLKNKQLKDQTPQNLLRALSRMGDLPPPTPEDEPEGAAADRRDSRPSIGAQSELGSVDEEEDDDEESDASGSDAGQHSGDDALVPPLPHEQQQRQLSQPPGPSASISDFFGPYREPPPQPIFDTSHSTSHSTSAALASGSRAHGLPHAFDDGDDLEVPLADEDDIDWRRMSAHSAALSPENMRRQSAVTSFGGTPVQLNNDGMDGFSQGGSPIRQDMGRLSGVSFDPMSPDSRRKSGLGSSPEISMRNNNLLTGASDDVDLRRRTFGSGAASEDDQEEAEATIANLLGKREGVKNLDDGSGDEDDAQELERYGSETGDFGPAPDVDEEFDDGERIPWADKGKGVAVDPEEAEEGEEGELELEGGQAGFEGMGFSDDEAPALMKAKMPKPPKLAKLAANRKKRAKKQRYTANGDPVVDLPKKLVKSLFLHYLGPNVKLEDDALEAVMDASQEFFAQMMGDASAYAHHAGRKSRINESDLVAMMYRQRVLTDKCGLQALGRQHGLDREFQGVIDAMGPDGKGLGKGRKERKRGTGREVAEARKRRRRDESDEEEAAPDGESDGGEAEEGEEEDEGDQGGSESD